MQGHGPSWISSEQPKASHHGITSLVFKCLLMNGNNNHTRHGFNKCYFGNARLLPSCNKQLPVHLTAVMECVNTFRPALTREFQSRRYRETELISRPTRKALMKGPPPSAMPLCEAALRGSLSADFKREISCESCRAWLLASFLAAENVRAQMRADYLPAACLAGISSDLDFNFVQIFAAFQLFPFHTFPHSCKPQLLQRFCPQESACPM